MPSKLSAFLSELRRRKVWRVAGVYASTALAVALAVAELYDDVSLPEGTPRVVIVLLLLGFPFALVLAWAYELKPEPRTLESREDEQVDSAASGGSEDATVIRKGKSIVVLPFDNMSPDPGDAYFCDGLTEEIITTLSQLRSLRVISRNSAMALKGTQKGTQAIAHELDVQYVLEGSVRKAGNDLRITAQLIDAADDAHLWAERYDGVLGDVFGIQEQVSRSIVGALELELKSTEEERFATRQVEDLRAYECYLGARYELFSMTDGALERSLALIDRGLEVVGDDHRLYALRGHVLFQMVNFMSAAPGAFEGLLGEAGRSAEQALLMNPESALAHAVLGAVSVNTGHPHEAVRHYAQAIRLEPGNPEGQLFLGWTVAAGGWDPEGSRRLMERAATLDPLTPICAGALGWLDWMLGDFDQALESFGPWLHQLEEGRSPWRALMAYLHAAGGNVEKAIPMVDRMVEDTPRHMLATLGTFLKHGWLGEKEQALGALTDDLNTGAWWDDVWPLLMASGFATIGERDRAFYWLNHAVDFGIANARYIEVHDPFLRELRPDESFAPLLRKADELSESLSALVDVQELLSV